jgi:hypothetical protein
MWPHVINMRSRRTWGEAPLENACEERDRVAMELETLMGFEDIYTMMVMMRAS